MQTLDLNLSTKNVIRSCINNCQMKVGTPRGGSRRGFGDQLPLHFMGCGAGETKPHKAKWFIQTHMLALLNECEGGSKYFMLELGGKSSSAGRDGVFSLCWETAGPERSCGVSALWAHCSWGCRKHSCTWVCVCVSCVSPRNSWGGEEGEERSGCVSCVC